MAEKATELADGDGARVRIFPLKFSEIDGEYYQSRCVSVVTTDGWNFGGYSTDAGGQVGRGRTRAAECGPGRDGRRRSCLSRGRRRRIPGGTDGRPGG